MCDTRKKRLDVENKDNDRTMAKRLYQKEDD
jgi:hypothetical protein